MKKTLFATARIPTPIFNTSSLRAYFGGEEGHTLCLDKENLLRCVETVLLPHTRITLVEKIPETPLWKIESEEYPYPGELFAHEHCLSLAEDLPPKRIVNLPSQETMLKMAESLTGTRYIWGGNWPLGIPFLTKLFSPSHSLQKLCPLTQDTWQLRGVDCSGLLYFLSDGYTPRNTSTLLHFGKAVPVEKSSLEEIISCVQPLDLIVFKGHVILILNREMSIESKPLCGVVQTPLKKRLTELLETKKPIDDPALCGSAHFVIRRWVYPSGL